MGWQKGFVLNTPLWAVAGIAILGTAGIAGAFVVASSGGEEEVVQQAEPATVTSRPSTTPAASALPSATASAVPSPEATVSSETPFPVPEGWQTYDDPKGRFSIRVPPNLTYASFSTVDGLAWQEFNIPGENDQNTNLSRDAAKVEILVAGKQEGESLEGFVAEPADPESTTKRLSFDYVTVNGQSGVRGSFIRDYGDFTRSRVTYVFERGNDWLIVQIGSSGPKAQEYLAQFDSLTIRSFIVR
jgi:hypothetical protein